MPKNDGLVLWQYDGCDTCRKARQWLAAHGREATLVPIVASPPSAAELRTMIAASGLPARKWLNTSGLSYRALVAARGKASVARLDDAALVALLARDGKLIKRPVLRAGERVLVGFDAAAYEALLGR